MDLGAAVPEYLKHLRAPARRGRDGDDQSDGHAVFFPLSPWHVSHTLNQSARPFSA
jgi:hypothetical protein